MKTTRPSTRGQVARPSAIRKSLAWMPGEFRLEEVAGCLRSKRKSKTLVQMDRSIRPKLIRRRDRGRY